MLKNLIWWFITLGLSFLVSNVFGLGTQGVVFIVIYLAISLFKILAIIISMLSLGTLTGFTNEAASTAVLLLVFAVIELLLSLILPFIISNLFSLDFYLSYQIVTFLSCFFSNKKK